MGKRVGIGVGLLLLILACGYVLADRYQDSPQEMSASYVGRDSCVDCHQNEAALFHGSDHDLAMDLATEETVLANFDDQTLDHYGIESRMFRDGDRFMINTEGPDGTMQDFEVKYVFGVRPLQQYMVEIDRPENALPNEIGKVQVLRVSWDTSRKSWFYLKPPDVDEKLEPNDPLHWTGITQNWNASCAVCHSTNLQKNFSPLANEYHTTFSEIDVSCEACHGPGSYHVELANRKSLFWDRNHGYGLAKLKTESNRPQIETCAPCHSRRSVVSDGFQPGCNFDDYFATQVVVDPIYHVDGQIRDEDYVYGSFIQSKMYHNGIRCTDCHDPHSNGLKHEGNLLCTSCHQHSAGKYDSINHHHHQPGTPGSYCVDCHMPATTYMMVDARRDHSFRVPRPELSVSLGTPNACSGCHIDSTKLVGRESEKPLGQYLDWIIAVEEGDEVVAAELKRVDAAMLEATRKWYSDPPAIERTKYYEQMAQGLAGGEAEIPTLVAMATDQRVPALLRASALSGLANDSGESSLEISFRALGDSDPKVVTAALMRLDAEIGRIGNRQQYLLSGGASELRPIVEAIAKLLDHPRRRVRIEAARLFASVDSNSRSTYSDSQQRKHFDRALRELKQSLHAENDRAASHMMLGGLHQMLDDPERAKDNYRAAIAVEPNLSGPRANLAALLDADAQRLQQQLRPSGAMRPEQLQQMRQKGEMMVRISKTVDRLRAQEHELLKTDVQRCEGIQGTHGVHYRYALSCFVQQDIEGTEKHLLEAYRQAPDIPTYQLGLATYFVHIKDGEKAMKYIRQLLKSDPRHPGYQSLRDEANRLIKEPSK